ncbi:MAG TPA: CocE/NonD family hydrolase [Steroidobacteraceae bacterium]
MQIEAGVVKNQHEAARFILTLFVMTCAALAPFRVPAAEGAASVDPPQVELRWGVKIPMRDGVHLQATVYTPRNQPAAAPCILTLTPYIAQSYHDRGMYFAAHGYPFLTVDVRGRGNSEGQFRPLIQEAKDGYDAVEWLAKQPYCNGKVAMWGGSYAGYDQWAAASQRPPHLATIVPAAAPYVGVDFPFRNNIFYTYDVQWLALVNGHAAQVGLFGDDLFWKTHFRHWLETGAAFESLGDGVLGDAAAIFKEWVSHPQQDDYWDRFNPSSEQYSRISLPILTITGSYDDDQPGALQHYREFMQHATAESKARHYLVIGPWDHAGTRTPNAQVGGLTFGPASMLDLPKLHLEWYAWTMQGGPKPAFLQKPVAYYVMQADRWRYADSLEAVTAQQRPYYLESRANATDVVGSGSLQPVPASGAPDHFVHDPRDTHLAQVEYDSDPESLTGQRMIYARRGQQLIYHTAPLERDTEVSGFFKLTTWIAIDAPDTDLDVRVYEVTEDGGSVLLATDLMRARYRDSLRESKLIQTKGPLRYDFDHFTFVSRLIRKNSRLRLVIAPLDSIYNEKNYNSGGVVASATLQAARPVTVTLYHDRAHQSALFVPVGQP